MDKDKLGYQIIVTILGWIIIYFVIAFLVGMLSLLIGALDFSWKLVTIIFLLRWLLLVCIPAFSQDRILQRCHKGNE